MITRREVLLRSMAAGAAALLRPAELLMAGAAQPATPVNFAVPAGLAIVIRISSAIRGGFRGSRAAPTRRNPRPWPRCGACMARSIPRAW
jgi:hypothetical protein